MLFRSAKADDACERLMEPHLIKCFFKCAQFSCSFATDNDSDFSDHLNSCYADGDPLCFYCEKKCTKKELAQHMIEAHGGRKFQCEVCLFRCCTKFHLIFHTLEDHNSNASRAYFCEPLKGFIVPDVKLRALKLLYRCPFCGFRAFNSDLFDSHISTEHSSEQINFRCIYCDKDCTDICSLKQHYDIEHNFALINCLYCGMGFNRRKDSFRHMVKEHADWPVELLFREDPSKLKEIETSAVLQKTESSGLVDFFCMQEGCFSKLSNITLFGNHLATTHYNDSVFQCPSCFDHSFPSIPLLFDHILSKHEPELFKCLCCYFTSRDKSVVETHTLGCTGAINTSVVPEEEVVNEESTSETTCIVPPTCQFCFLPDYKMDPDSYAFHVKKRHKAEYFCRICLKAFERYRIICLHIKREHGTFEDIMSLNRHNKLTTSSRVRKWDPELAATRAVEAERKKEEPDNPAEETSKNSTVSEPVPVPPTSSNKGTKSTVSSCKKSTTKPNSNKASELEGLLKLYSGLHVYLSGKKVKVEDLDAATYVPRVTFSSHDREVCQVLRNATNSKKANKKRSRR